MKASGLRRSVMVVRVERRSDREGVESEETRRGEKKGRVDVAWGSFSRSRLPSPGTRSARIFLLASTEDQTSHFISADPFKPPSPCLRCSTLLFHLYYPYRVGSIPLEAARSILPQPPLRHSFLPQLSLSLSLLLLLPHVSQSYG